jgi:hypothetical protein
MDITEMLTELRQEREHIEEAILVLQRLAAGQGKRRGRPPAWMSRGKPLGQQPNTTGKGNRVVRNAAHSLRMKAYWAKRRKQTAK